MTPTELLTAPLTITLAASIDRPPDAVDLSAYPGLCLVLDRDHPEVVTADHRIPVASIATHAASGMTVDQLAADLDVPTGQVADALAYAARIGFITIE